jgi:hypothetical protein
VILVLYSVYVPNYIYLFVCVETSLHPWNENNLIVLYNLFHVLLNLVCKYLVEDIFTWMFIRVIG